MSVAVPALPNTTGTAGIRIRFRVRKVEREIDGGIERYGVKAAAVARNDVAYFARFSTIFVQFSASSHIDYTVHN